MAPFISKIEKFKREEKKTVEEAKITYYKPIKQTKTLQKTF